MKVLFFIMFCVVSFQASANLGDQLSAIKKAEQVNQNNVAEKNAELALQAKKLAKKKAEADKRAYNERMAKIKAQRANEEVRRKAEKERMVEIESERLADKYREQSFEDQVRQMKLDEMRLELERKKTRIAREDDLIDSELKHANAKTDVLQSEADANRNVSTGVKSALESEGRAKEEKASKWFGN